MEQLQPNIETLQQIKLHDELQAQVLVGHSQIDKILKLNFKVKEYKDQHAYLVLSRCLHSSQSSLGGYLVSENFNTLELDKEGYFTRLESDLLAKIFPFLNDPHEKVPRGYSLHCWFDGPNDQGTYLSTNIYDKSVFLIKAQGEPIKLPIEHGFDRPVAGALCKQKDHYALAEEDQSLLYFYVPNKKSSINDLTLAKTPCVLQKIAFITPTLLLALGKDANLYTIGLSKYTRKRKVDMVPSYNKKSLKDSAGNALQAKNFAINSILPWLIMIYCTSEDKALHQPALYLLNLKNNIKKLHMLLNVDDVTQLWFTNNKFGWKDSVGKLQVHSFELLPRFDHSLKPALAKKKFKLLRKKK